MKAGILEEAQRGGIVEIGFKKIVIYGAKPTHTMGAGHVIADKFTETELAKWGIVLRLTKDQGGGDSNQKADKQVLSYVS